MASRVVITGIGIVSPLGCSRERFWSACLEGRSGVHRLDTPWVTETGLTSTIAATVTDFDPRKAGIVPKRERVLDRTSMFAIGAAAEAVEDAGFRIETSTNGRERRALDGVDPRRVATVIGSGIGGITSLEVSHALWRQNRSKAGIKRFSLPMLIPNAPAGEVAIHLGARGECKSVSTACAAGTMALGDAWRILERGEADVAVAGGVEGAAADEDAYGLLGFERLNTLSKRNDEPERASRPFDLHRDGFVFGEGAAVLVLEREEHARARGASAYAAVAGYAANCDAQSMMQLDESGESVVHLVRAALVSAGLDPADVDYVSAHGTSTVLNDRTEAKALCMLFGHGCDDLPVTALKSMTGHAIAGSGPLETAAAALSLAEGVLTPTINYETPDPDCPLRVVANAPWRRQAEVCVKLSYGFGGHNACLVLTRA
jgi:3-oxoacyl-[acyl-carrier-protein] synthase II